VQADSKVKVPPSCKRNLIYNLKERTVLKGLLPLKIKLSLDTQKSLHSQQRLTVDSN
jgi:hypothetical protein